MIAHTIPKGDLVLENGTTKPISGAEYARQKVEAELTLFLGEWFLDTRKGVAYFRDVLIKNPNPSVVDLTFRSKILSVPGIVSVPVLEITSDTAARHMSVRWEALYQDGTPIGSTVETGL